MTEIDPREDVAESPPATERLPWRAPRLTLLDVFDAENSDGVAPDGGNLS